MTTTCRSVALIQHPEKLEASWLTFWNATRQYLDFVTAERLAGDSFRECLDREIAWVLDLRRGKDYLVSSMARLHLEFPQQTSDGETTVAIEFFVTDLYGKAGWASVELNSQLHWLTCAEVLDGRTSDGRRLNPQLVDWLQQADVIARHAG